MSATTKKADMSRYVTKANLAGAFFENAAMLGAKPLLFHKSKGKWTGKNWDEVADSVRRLAGALVAAMRSSPIGFQNSQKQQFSMLVPRFH